MADQPLAEIKIYQVLDRSACLSLPTGQAGAWSVRADKLQIKIIHYLQSNY